MAFTVASFNLQNLASPGRPVHHRTGLTAEEFGWKVEWISDQLLAMDADIVAFQEVFDAAALAAVIARTDSKAAERADGRYGGTLWRGGPFRPYGAGAFRYAPNINGTDGRLRPGLAVVSRHEVLSTEVVQDIAGRPLSTVFMQLGAGHAGQWTLSRLSRPIQSLRLRVEGREVALFNVHLKSPSGEFPHDGSGALEEDLLRYDPIGRGLGLIRANLRRLGEALAARREVVASLDAGLPVIVAGDVNSYHEGDASLILAGERPEPDYTVEERPDGSGCWTTEEAQAIRERIEALRLDSAERVQTAGTGARAFHTTAFGGVYESLDRLFLSVHFREGAVGQVGRLEHLRVIHDHLNDGGLGRGHYDRLVSDHGPIIARLAWL